MNENFDCTQFITFNLAGTNRDKGDMLEKFEDIGFKLIYMNEIRQVKKKYFQDYIQDEFIELKCDNFIGEFEDWELLEYPPEKISKFANVIDSISKNKEIKDLKIILTSFAEEGYSSNEVIKVRIEAIREGLFSMSKHYYDVWTDNLILEIF